MNDPNIKIKQQIVEKIKVSTNILVTVSRDPTVDDLSAAIGLTAMLNNMGKHATAIFSGAIPPAITFLEPDKVFEGTADSLRDFIIALDKEKADHLRYKIEGDVVKIFITPYRTTITGEDLEFSQGDFNVELVLALGVANKDHLDNAIAAHGQILHDVTIATLSAGEQISELGSMDWHDDEASSLSEMVTAISDSLKTDKSLLDKQISTALLTGIVFATDRFSNTRTTSKVMTMAAQLMAGGADQQLIAAKLNEEHEISPSTTVNSIKNMSESDGAVDMPIEMEKIPETIAAPVPDPGMLRVSHEEEDEEVIPPTSTLPPEEEIRAAAEAPMAEQVSTLPSEEAQEPSLGGTLNATTDQAAEDNRRAQEDDKNKTILSHSYLVGSEPDVGSAINSAAPVANVQPNIDIFANSPAADDSVQSNISTVAPKIEDLAPTAPEDVISTLPPTNPVAIGVEPDSRDNDEARLAVESAFGTQLPVQPAVGLPMPPDLPVPEFSTLPPQETPFDFSAASLAATPSTAPEQSVADDPTKFRIPGQ